MVAKQFKFRGFEPQEELVRLASTKYNYIFSVCPSCASQEAVLQKSSTGFRGSIKIQSSKGNFEAELEGKDPEKIVAGLVAEIELQLASWKSARFV